MESRDIKTKATYTLHGYDTRGCKWIQIGGDQPHHVIFDGELKGFRSPEERLCQLSQRQTVARAGIQVACELSNRSVVAGVFSPIRANENIPEISALRFSSCSVRRDALIDFKLSHSVP